MPLAFVVKSDAPSPIHVLPSSKERAIVLVPSPTATHRPVILCAAEYALVVNGDETDTNTKPPAERAREDVGPSPHAMSMFATESIPIP